ncbi:MAG: hypothetical protein EOP00_24670 [Pedobacter sp.]|nr:MAG: hypothetical protein EOP00_24670 [Pedobacter sp.]
MENQNLEQERNGAKSVISQSDQLEWGDHNKELTDLNFIDRKPKDLAKQEDLVSSSQQAVDLSNEEEPGRNRKGVREGASKLDG